jgi:hypothetical protein
VICILPQTQKGEDPIVVVNKSVAISAVRWFIVLCQRKEPITACRGWLWGEVTKKLCSIIDGTVAISIQRKKSIIGTGSCPRQRLFETVGVQIESDTAVQISKPKTIALNIN